MTHRGAQQGTTQSRLAATVAAALAAVLLALSGVKLFLAFVAPLDAGGAPERRAERTVQRLSPDLGVLRTADLFVQESEAEVFAAAEELPETTLRLILKSATPTEGGESGAIIQTPDGKQVYFREGDQIVRGATLTEVQTFRAVITRNGRREALTLKDRPEPEGDALPEMEGIRQPASQAPGPRPDEEESDPALTSFQIPLPPDIDRRGAAATLRNLAGERLDILEAQGFRGDDIPYAVNGEIISSDPSGYARVFEQVQRRGTVIITVARDGQSKNIRFNTPALAAPER
ncbi:MAG: type II secretion system protein N [Pseudomonadota bacterium]